ncbi:hypothetical protein DFH11DRAFT_194492 [Phellopilus nigrolimitatus]|nr:hypothetical protein DFH11DRAFT_194492 [Phellopilus nigrolimitatus]
MAISNQVSFETADTSKGITKWADGQCTQQGLHFYMLHAVCARLVASRDVAATPWRMAAGISSRGLGCKAVGTRNHCGRLVTSVATGLARGGESERTRNECKLSSSSNKSIMRPYSSVCLPWSSVIFLRLLRTCPRRPLNPRSSLNWTRHYNEYHAHAPTSVSVRFQLTPTHTTRCCSKTNEHGARFHLLSEGRLAWRARPCDRSV